MEEIQLENKEDREIELFWLEGIGLTRKQILDWYYHSNEQSIPESLKNKSLSPHTFVAGGLVFDVVYQSMRPQRQLFEILKLRLLLIKMRLSQFLFPSSFILRIRG